MTATPWPAGFPYPSRSGYQQTLGNLSQRTQFPIGARQRQLYTDANERFAVSFQLTSSQMAFFQAWLRYTLNGGTSWMQLPLQAAGTVMQREARFVTGTDITSVPLGVDDYQVTAQIETRQGTSMDRATYDLLNATGGPDASVALMQATEDTVNG